MLSGWLHHQLETNSKDNMSIMVCACYFFWLGLLYYYGKELTFSNIQEVAVKKFLDQEFYGDALDEFRCEVC
jgi:hypothetical protein